MSILILLLSFYYSCSSISLPVTDIPSSEIILGKVNRIRTEGCYCGRKYMKPTSPVKWNSKLYKSALGHAKEMKKYNYFSHFSRSGKDIGDRLDIYGYNWQVAGENLGEGQITFDEVLKDWMKSRSHCKMLMNPKVDEMAVAKHGKYWVQHFGKQLPKGTIKKGRLEQKY